MPIFDQGYQHWHGTLSSHAWRWLTITREGVRAQFRKKGTKWTVITAFAPCLLLAGFLILWGLLEQGSSLLQPFMFLLQGLPDEIRQGPEVYRAAIWTLAYDFFFRIQTFFSMILVANVGPDLISQDLRFNALPLYLSRPLRRIDYFLGKLGVIGFFLGIVTIGPAIVAYLLGLAFSFELSVLRDTARVLLGAVGYGTLVVVSAGTLMLAISSLTRSSRFVAALWVGLWIVSGMAAQTLEQSVRQEWCPIISYVNNLGRVRESMLGTVAARDQILDLIERTRQAAIATARNAAMVSGPFRRFGAREVDRFAETPPDRIEPPGPLKLMADEFPWTWSAGVLGGLFVLSAWTLSTRVKTLDRLK